MLDQITLNHANAPVLNTHYWQVTGNPAYTEGGYYPWNPATPSATNQAPANIGQLKAVFALRFDSLEIIPPDTDNDSLADAWELTHFGNLAQNASGDNDLDGLNNLSEFQLGTNPTNPDTEGDGMSDGWEKYYNFDPLNNTPSTPTKMGALDDLDNDGKNNRMESEAGTIPFSASERPTLTLNPHTMRWFGVSGVSYELQWTTNLVNWNIYPTTLHGTNQELAVLVSTVVGGPPPGLFFYRLRIYPTTTDIDSDGMDDNWEILHFGNLDSADPNAVPQPDGLSNLEKSNLGLSPQINYSAETPEEASQFSYDLAGRLIEVSSLLAPSTFTLDEEGNLNAQ